jgi:hypothetical protein
MKIVINTCYGGFDLSEEAQDLYYTKKGITFYKHNDHVITLYYKVPKEEFEAKKEKGWPNMTMEEKNEVNSLYLSQYKIERIDPTLIEVVEELGSRANGEYCELKIVDVPDDVDWQLEEYDGKEWIAEVHRIWS